MDKGVCAPIGRGGRNGRSLIEHYLCSCSCSALGSARLAPLLLIAAWLPGNKLREELFIVFFARLNFRDKSTTEEVVTEIKEPGPDRLLLRRRDVCQQP
ncbi:hypothetical protein Q5P01_015992 [Channa striata]|uniref:Uncharacterized protein n=1 Tax=Channa striata TaxID=64152 RepID=A0AA88MDA8_CHASR|nr:hypothetical protein Q5P01_015992 [Channa striata]